MIVWHAGPEPGGRLRARPVRRRHRQQVPALPAEEEGGGSRGPGKIDNHESCPLDNSFLDNFNLSIDLYMPNT